METIKPNHSKASTVKYIRIDEPVNPNNYKTENGGRPASFSSYWLDIIIIVT